MVVIAKKAPTRKMSQEKSRMKSKMSQPQNGKNNSDV